jgi:hypothetical protein
MADESLESVSMSGPKSKSAKASAKAKNLLLEANRVNYRLRSSFFLRKVKEYQSLAIWGRMEGLNSDWNPKVVALTAIGVSKKAAEIGHDSKIPYALMFCDPSLIQKHPEIIAYYRNIAALSQKSVKYLTNIDVKPFESDAFAKPDLEIAKNLAKLFNEHVSIILESTLGKITRTDIQAIFLTSVGAQIDGAWRNAVGEEAEKLVKNIILEEAIERKIIIAVIGSDNRSVSFDLNMLDSIVANLDTLRGIVCKSATAHKILFSSEPDISIFDSKNKLLAVVEVKGGADPAGALERFGAAKKSFQNELIKYPNIKTMLVASCFTDEVLRRLEEEISNGKSLIHEYYNLSEIMSDYKIRCNFIDSIFK